MNPSEFHVTTTTLSFLTVKDFVLKFEVDLLVDSDLRILMTGQVKVFDGLIGLPTSLYADLSELFQGTGRFHQKRHKRQRPYPTGERHLDKGHHA